MAADFSQSFDRRTGRVIAALVAAIGIGLALVIIAMAAAGSWTHGALLTWVIIAGLAFNVFATLARWIVTHNGRQIFLAGYYPFVLGLVKLVGLISVGAIVLVALVVGIIEPSSRQWLLEAVILGLIEFAIIVLVANGLANGLIITRHLNGTLNETSRTKRQGGPSLRA